MVSEKGFLVLEFNGIHFESNAIETPDGPSDWAFQLPFEFIVHRNTCWNGSNFTARLRVHLPLRDDRILVMRMWISTRRLPIQQLCSMHRNFITFCQFTGIRFVGANPFNAPN